jgi:hypothetical protein
LGGLEDVLTEEGVMGDITYKSKFNTFALSTYGLSLQDAENIREEYKAGTKGTICN